MPKRHWHLHKINIIQELHELGIHKGTWRSLPDNKSTFVPATTPIAQQFFLSKSETDFCIANVTGFAFGVLTTF